MSSKKDLEFFDMLTFSYRNFALIHDLTNLLRYDVEIPQEVISAENRSLIRELYFTWCDKRTAGKPEIPLNPGTMLMISWAVIVHSRQYWLDLLPETPISKSSPEWGLHEARLHFSAEPDPSIKKVVHKIRNAISHADYRIRVSRGAVSPWKVFLKESKIIFRDSSRGNEDFELEISFNDLAKLNNKIYETIAEKIGISKIKI